MGVLLAKQYGGEVVSVDSMQIYRGMTIGSAAPTAEEMGGCAPPHGGGGGPPLRAGPWPRFTQEADRRVQDILRARGNAAGAGGGTGLYLDALIDGRTFAAGQSGGAVRRELEERLAAEGVEPLLSELRQADPEAAARLHSGDEKRIIRALEVWRETGRTITEHNRETQRLPKRYDPLYIGLTFRDRGDLRARIDRRVDAMAAGGLLEEVRALRDRRVPREATALQAIGYKELLSWLDGETALEAALDQVKLRSRQYAKRQLTWFRRNPEAHWLLWEKNPNFGNARQRSTELLEEFGLG